MYAIVDESHHYVGPYEKAGGMRREPFENTLPSQHFGIQIFAEFSKADLEKTLDIFVFAVSNVRPCEGYRLFADSMKGTWDSIIASGDD